jgi:hypothetical protein
LYRCGKSPSVRSQKKKKKYFKLARATLVPPIFELYFSNEVVWYNLVNLAENKRVFSPLMLKKLIISIKRESRNSNGANVDGSHVGSDGN